MHQIYKASIIAIFGQGARKPAVAAAARLGLLAAAAIGIGHVLAMGLQQQFAAPGLPLDSLFFLLAFLVQASVAFVLVVSFNITQAAYQDKLARLLLSWPLPVMTRWIAITLPSLVLAALTLLLIGEPIVIITHQLGLEFWAIGLAFVTGLLSGLGLILGLPRIYPVLRLGFIVLVLWGEGAAVQALFNQPDQKNPYIWLLSGAMIVLSLLLYVGARFTAAAIMRTSHARVVRVSLPPAFWLIQKIFRSKSVFLNFLVNLGLACIFVFLTERYGDSNYQVVGGLLAALLAGSLAADVRGLARRNNPPEIYSLRGTAAYMLSQVVGAFAVAFLSVVPILIAAILAGNNVALLLAQFILGVCAGICAGTAMVPAARDIMGQFLATLLCFAVLVGVPQITRGASDQLQVMVIVASAVSLVLVAFVIEFSRNTYIWRKKHV